MISGKGDAPGERHGDYPKDAVKKALKCDLCADRPDVGPACVQAYPTGAAIRVSPQQFFNALANGSR
jgi:Fe-S-cluster-containing hydrogenase component 2